MSKNLLKSGYVVATMTMIARITGLVRDLLLAAFLGAGPGMDAFVIAFRMPNFFRRLFAEGAFSQAFVPVLSEYRQKRREAEVKVFINRMAGTLSIVLFILTVIAVLITPVLVMIFAPGFIHDPTRFGLASAMLKITFPYLLFISLTAFAGSILNSYDIFSVPAFTPVLLNLSMIFGAIILAPHFTNPVMGVAWGVFIGGIVQLLFQLPFLYRIKKLPIPKIGWSDPGVRRVIKLMAPAILGVSVAQISFFIDNILASFLREGSITWLYFSDRLTNFPLGVFGIAIATVVLPHLSRKHSDKNPQAFSASLDWALRCILVIGIPAAVGLFILAGPLLSTILQHGKFDAFDVEMARLSTMAFALGLPGFMLVKSLATAFYSTQDIKTPVKVAIISLTINIIIAVILIFPLKHAGLALSTSITTSLNASLLLILLRKRKIYLPQPGWLIFFIRLAIANAAMAIFLLLTTARLTKWLDMSWESRIIHLAPLLAGAGLIYIACLLLVGMRWQDFQPH